MCINTIRPEITSIKRLLLHSALIFLSVITATHANENKSTGGEALLGEALQRLAPDFEQWQPKDYSKDVIEYFSDTGATPGSIVTDLNSDGLPDAILDGRLANHCHIIVLLSEQTSYQLHTLPTDETFRQCNEGDFPRTYYLSTEKDVASSKVTSVYLSFPQQENARGELIADGYMIRFQFDGETFNRSLEVL